MMRRLPAIALLLLGAAAPLAAQVIRTDQYEAIGQADELDRTSGSTDLKFREDAYSRMTVPVRVAGHGPYRFLVDTGADRTAISSELASRLGLQDAGPATLYSVTGQSRVGTARVPLLDYTARKVTNLDAALLDRRFMGADGILGLDSLRSQRIQFDFKNETLTIVPSKARVREEDGTIVVTGRIRNGRLVLTDAWAENSRVTLVVDTGAEVSLGNEALRRTLMRAGALEKSDVVELISVTGEKLVGQFWVIDELEVGGVILKGLPVVFADTHAFQPLGLADRPALLLGMNALRGFEKVSIDFARRKLRVVLASKSAAILASR